MTTSTLDLGWPQDWRDAADKGVCLHCGNELGRFWQPADGPFCCRGCRGVWEMIHEARLERYYELKPAGTAPAASLRPDSFAWLDRLLATRGDEVVAGPLRLNLDIQGVHCAACVWLIEELFKRQPAGVQLRINPALGTVELAWDPARGDLKGFLAEVEKFGYRLGPSRKGARHQSRALLMRMAIAIAMALNVMMFSLSYYFGLAPQDGHLYRFFGWLSLVLATIALLAGGGVFYQGALAGLRRRVLHLDVPIALGMTLAWAGSVWGFLHGGPEQAYFDSLTVFIALMLVGRWAQEHILERNRNALLDSSGAENLIVKRVREGILEPVGAPEVVRGDELWIAPGDLLPVDGILMRRPTAVSLDWITGESDRVAREPGDTVPAGAFNASHHGFTVTATEDFADSSLQDLLRSAGPVDDDFRPQWWHRISGWYVTIVLTAAAAGFVGWIGHGLTPALKVAVSVLVVTCPCALGLAAPLAEELTHTALRRAGIFLRKPSFLEKALAVRQVLLDKTGTLTLGQLAPTPESRDRLAALATRAPGGAAPHDRPQQPPGEHGPGRGPAPVAGRGGRGAGHRGGRRGPDRDPGRGPGAGPARRRVAPGPGGLRRSGRPGPGGCDRPHGAVPRRPGRGPVHAAGGLQGRRRRRGGRAAGRRLRRVAAERRRPGEGGRRRPGPGPAAGAGPGRTHARGEGGPGARRGPPRHPDGGRRPERQPQLRGRPLRGHPGGGPAGPAGQGRLLLPGRRASPPSAGPCWRPGGCAAWCGTTWPWPWSTTPRRWPCAWRGS